MYFCSPKNSNGAVAQLVEQRTENPCVTGSIPVSTTPYGREIQQAVENIAFSAAFVLLLYLFSAFLPSINYVIYCPDVNIGNDYSMNNLHNFPHFYFSIKCFPLFQ